MGIADPFCVGLVAVGEAVQKGKDVIRCNLLNLEISGIQAEPVNDGLIRSQGIFFRVSLVVIDPDFSGFGHFNGLPPVCNPVRNKGLTFGEIPR